MHNIRTNVRIIFFIKYLLLIKIEVTKLKSRAKEIIKNKKINKIEVENMLLKKEIKRFKNSKEKIESQFGFNIPNYIIDEIINNNNYNNLCSLVNLAVFQNRLTKEQGIIIKHKYNNLKF